MGTAGGPALRGLEQKLVEAKSRSEMLVTRHRRARAAGKANRAQMAIEDGASSAAFDRMKGKITRAEAVSSAEGELMRDDLEMRLAKLGQEDEIEKLLTDLKSRRSVAS